MRALAVSGVTSNHFIDCAPPNILARASTDRIVEYPYRDDAMLLWAEIHEWTKAYVHHCYSGDLEVGQDLELRAWVGQLQMPVSEGGAPGFPAVETRAELAWVLTRIIFAASVEHAAVGFAQRTDMAYAPGFSLGWWRPPPRASEEIGDLERLAFMPPLEIARRQVDFLNLIGGVVHTRLGYYESNRFPYRAWFDDPVVNSELLPKFQAGLAHVEQVIRGRNLSRPWPYVHSLPSAIPMSVNI
jgi:arachidonate 15-lipoxygenase